MILRRQALVPAFLIRGAQRPQRFILDGGERRPVFEQHPLVLLLRCRFLGNIFFQGLWLSLKYERIDLPAFSG